MTKGRGKKHYPPAHYRYREKHPTVSLVVTQEIKELLDNLRTEEGSYGKAIKKLLSEWQSSKVGKLQRENAQLKRELAETKEELDETKEEYFEQGKIQWFQVPCSKCGKPIDFFSIDDNWDQVYEELCKAFKYWSHDKCP